ncbi:hypothetical protein [Agarivorans sp. 1_MG-2023]|uniref:hypothetical protein n=1 Tax=Agarivorans sp. 1_MG-2023 TaxID=3062634 RepID=UPI0026E47A43|nr:hypothetical protein [Agarivorans sp. 1_MG-2023]MDO6765096.1 hypothetical protein [Agarivorans sp. 1_MG-2023]
MKMLIKRLSVPIAIVLMAACGSESGSSGGTVVYSGTGQVGSLAALVEFQGDLHAINMSQSVSILRSEEFLSTDYVNRHSWGAETLHVYENSHVMVGHATGVDIYRSTGDLDYPVEFVARLSHLVAYDPVVAHDGVAYYTTRDGSNEITFRDGIFVENISDILAYVPPSQEEIDEGASSERPNSTSMAEYRELADPIGLTLREGTLYVCDAAEGLVSLALEINPDDAAEFSHLLVKQELNDVFSCNDVIATEQGLMLVGENGVYQLDVSDSGLSVVSHIPTT